MRNSALLTYKTKHAKLNFFSRIETKLNLLFITMVTLVFGIMGIIDFFETRAVLIKQINDKDMQIRSRLQMSVTKALWDLQNDDVDSLIQTEMVDSELLEIAVIAQEQLIAGYRRTNNALEKLTQLSDENDHTQSFDLIYKLADKNNLLGKVIFKRSLETLIKGTYTVLWQTIAEIIIADVLLIMGLSLCLRLIVLRPMIKTKKALDQIAEGDADLSLRLNDQLNDELGAMANSFNTFAAGLQNIIAQIQDSAVELSATAQQTNLSTEKIYQSLQKEKSETIKIADAIVNLIKKIAIISNHAQLAVDGANNSDQTARLGLNVVNDSINVMNKLRAEMKNSTSFVQSLAADAEHIVSVVQVIQEITQQTNLLALNAAIEAARAGENGRGFAVVADEVRKLATRTQSSTEDIQKMIQSLQNSVRQVVVAMEKSQTQVEAAVTNVDHVGLQMNEVSATIQKIATINRDIALASQDQNAAVIEINHSIQMLDQLMANTEQNSSHNFQASQQLAQLASSMKTLVERFKI